MAGLNVLANYDTILIGTCVLIRTSWYSSAVFALLQLRGLVFGDTWPVAMDLR